MGFQATSATAATTPSAAATTTALAAVTSTTIPAPAVTTTTGPVATTAPNGLAPSTTTTGPAATTTVPSASAALSQAEQNASWFGGEVTTLGADHYSDTFAGAEVIGSTLSLQVAPAGDQATFEAAITTLNTANVPLAILNVAHSWSWFNMMQSALFDQTAKLAADGIRLAESDPDYVTNSIQVALQPPSIADENALQQALGLGSLPELQSFSAYATAAAQLLTSQFGSGLTVLQSPEPLGSLLSSRITGNGLDEADYISDLHSDQCTSGFAVYGAINNSNHYSLTAGHCSYADDGYQGPSWSGDGWYVPGPPPGQEPGNYLGPVSTDYECDGADDVETVGPDSNVGPYVYGGPAGDSSPPVYSVVGPLVPAVGSYIAADGANSGEVRDIPVVQNNAYFTEPITCTSGVAYVAHAVKFTQSLDGVTTCQGGDSGGPIYQHTSSNFDNVVAIGDIDYTSQGYCFGETIGSETSDSNTELMIAP